MSGSEAELRIEPASDPRVKVGRYSVFTRINHWTLAGSFILLSVSGAALFHPTLFGLTVDECLLGTTRNAARALGLAGLGTLTPGAPADLAIWDINDPAELVYRIGFNPLHRRIFNGAI